MDIVSTGSIRRVIVSPDGDVWLIKAPVPESSWNAGGPFGMISCERWRSVPPGKITVTTASVPPHDFPPAVTQSSNMRCRWNSSCRIRSEN